MTKFLITAGCCLLISFLFIGCGKRLQLDDALQNGARQLSGGEIRRVLTDATVNLTSWDELYTAEIKLYADGRLRAKNEEGEKDMGTWKLSDDKRFCLEFEEWLPEDMTCYSVTENGKSYRLFSRTGDYAFALEVTEEGDPEAFRRQRSTGPSPKRTEEATEKTSWYSFLLPGNDDEVSKQIEKPQQSLKAELRHLLEDKECVGCDLSGEDLSGKDLDDADLEGAILTGANLSGANLADSNLSGANLSGAMLKKADLRDAVLKNAVLAGADLEMAFLEETNLEAADLSNTRLVDTVLDEAKLSGANLKGADLHWASLRDSDLKGADLGNAYLVKANFRGADLTGANLDGAVIQRTDFKNSIGYSDETNQAQEMEAEEKDSGWWFF